MQPLTVKHYLHASYLDERFDFLELLKALQPDPDDRTVIEEEIKDAVNGIIGDETSETGLQQLANAIAISDFRILRSEPIANYWNILQLKKFSLRNTMEKVQNLNRRYNTRSCNEERQSDEFHEIDGIMLTGMDRSAGTIIKTKAIRLVKRQKVMTTLTTRKTMCF